MNDPMDPQVDPQLDQALDTALQRALFSPPLPAYFRARLQAALVRAGNVEPLPRAAMEAEYSRQVLSMHEGYVRLQRRTLGTLIGVAFVTGIGLTLVMPWLRANYGEAVLLVVPGIGALAGVIIGARSWLQRTAAARLLRDL
jgi:hypothetical protein